MTFSQAIHIIAVLLTGLVAGLFYSYACSVTGALGRLSDREYFAAFQAINKEILNPWFFASFMGSLLVLPLASWFAYSGGAQTSFYLLLAATVVYFIGVFGVTMVFNVPINEQIARVNIDPSAAKELISMRNAVEGPWNKYNLLRTIAAILSFLLTVLSILKK